MINFSEILSRLEHITIVLSEKFSKDIPLLQLVSSFDSNKIFYYSEKNASLYQFLFPNLKFSSKIDKKYGIYYSLIRKVFPNENILITPKNSNIEIVDKSHFEFFTELMNFKFPLRKNFTRSKSKTKSEEYFVPRFLQLLLKNDIIKNASNPNHILDCLEKNKKIITNDNELCFLCEKLELTYEKKKITDIVKEIQLQSNQSKK
jgi:hypothetical protein